MSSTKPVIFISYSHKDEPKRTADAEVQWLTEIQRHLAPAVRGTFELWTDEDIDGGADWETDIKTKLAVCDICILLVSRHSLASKYVMEVEIETIRERQRLGHNVQIYPIVLSPFPQTAAPASLLALNLRPRLDKPLSRFDRHQRGIEISKIANEIVAILGGKRAVTPTKAPRPTPPAYVHITGLPETAYERLVGRDAELKRLDDAWANTKTNILSLIAEGGAGKSALVNEWLGRMQADNYRGAEAVLGWSFYSQGSKERATSAEEFLNWALDKLGLRLAATTSAPAKGEAIAEALAKRRALLALDGVEPLQHGLDKQQGELKDQGLRALLRRFAAMPPAAAHSLVVLTSRLPVKDIARWHDGAAPVVDVDRLSETAGAALLRDNGVWGTDHELAAAVRAFGGHPLALVLLASFVTETQKGDVRRRDHVRERPFFADPENPRHDHARRLMESLEQDWIPEQPWLRLVLRYLGPFYRPAGMRRLLMREIMLLVGLFDGPATGDCLHAVRRNPRINGLTDAIVAASADEWQRAVARLREVRLLAPPDLAAPDALDAHPLVREWFGERLRQTNRTAWRAAQSRLYEHLRDTLVEGETLTPESVTSLYHAIGHGCRAGRHQEALHDIYVSRIWFERYRNGFDFYSMHKLGIGESELPTIAYFFSEPYRVPVNNLTLQGKLWVLSHAGLYLRGEGRCVEALLAHHAELKIAESEEEWKSAARAAASVSLTHLLIGDVSAALDIAIQAVRLADRAEDGFQAVAHRALRADALHAIGRREEARNMFLAAEALQSAKTVPLLYSIHGYNLCELLLGDREWEKVRERALRVLSWEVNSDSLMDRGLVRLMQGRASIGLALESVLNTDTSIEKLVAFDELDDAVSRLRVAGQMQGIPHGLLARAAFRRSVGSWDSAARDLDEVEEIAEPAPMRLFLCDMALERARLAFARSEAFAPLNGLTDDSPPKPERAGEAERKRLHDEAAKQLAIAADYIDKCGYHKRDEELAELQEVQAAKRTFASLPPRV